MMALNTGQIETAHIGHKVGSRQSEITRNAGLVLSASVLMALAAHLSFPLFFSPVPITMQPLAMLLIAFFLGPRRASAAMVLYLLEGAGGLPVFSPAGPGGIAQLTGVTGGFLMATPWAAFLAGYLAQKKRVVFLVMGAVAAEVVLFAFGLAWFMAVSHSAFAASVSLAVVPFLPGEVLKVLIAVSAASLWQRRTA